MKLPDEARSRLRQYFIEALQVYTDYRQEGEKVVMLDYLRLVPLDAPPFRHGLSIGIRLDRKDGKIVNELPAKEAVADYLVDSFEHFLASEPVLA